MVKQTQLYTIDDFEAFINNLPGDHDRLFELVNGEITEKMPTQLHALIANFFNALLYLYNQQHQTIWVFSEVRISLLDDDENARIPDIAVVLKAGRDFDPDRPLTYMPDLIIEIQAPGQGDKFMVDKAGYYLAKGARMVWLVYPDRRLVEVLTATDRKLLTEAHMLDGGEVLPGFTVAVTDIFAQG